MALLTDVNALQFMDYSLQGQARSPLSCLDCVRSTSAPARPRHHFVYGFCMVAYSFQNGFKEIHSIPQDFFPLTQCLSCSPHGIVRGLKVNS